MCACVGCVWVCVCVYVHVCVCVCVCVSVGGWSRDDPSCPVEQFCTQHNEWKMSAPMIRHRGDTGVCSLEGLIYTVGGYDDVTCMSSVER